MGEATGFLKYPRLENPFREVKARLEDFADLHETRGEEERHQQASRCMYCGVPFCQSDFGCPLHNLIPEWNDLLCRGLEREALERLLMTAPFPEFTGRVCPALCEKACNLADDGVTNRDNELYLIEKGFERGWVQPRLPARRSGRRAAVIGSGPAGLAAADLLNQLGHEVTVFERADRPGGLLMYGIPNMKLPKEILDRRVRLLEAEGISFRLNTEASPALTEDFDAVLFCGGARKPRALPLDRPGAKGVYYAVDFLTEATRSLLKGQESPLSAREKHVVVVGGGDTGNDCVGTALRQGCASVIQLEMMPAAPKNRPDGNPWPLWPRVLRTDYGQQEALFRQGEDPRIYETTVSSLDTDAEGRLISLTSVKVGKNPEGRLGPLPGTEQTLACDLLLIAAGFVGCDEGTLNAFMLKADARGRLRRDDATHALGGKYFSAGDMRTGQSLVVRALADGREAAREVHAYLSEI